MIDRQAPGLKISLLDQFNSQHGQELTQMVAAAFKTFDVEMGSHDYGKGKGKSISPYRGGQPHGIPYSHESADLALPASIGVKTVDERASQVIASFPTLGGDDLINRSFFDGDEPAPHRHGFPEERPVGAARFSFPTETKLVPIENILLQKNVSRPGLSPIQKSARADDRPLAEPSSQHPSGRPVGEKRVDR